MQFGRLLGTLLITLGIILLAIQFLFTQPKKEVRTPPQAVELPAEQRSNPWPGIAGGAALIAGFVAFFTARRSDEPDPKHAVK
jgi:hypothetical protein